MDKKKAIERLNSLENEAKELRKLIEMPEDLFSKIKNYSDVCRELNIREYTENDFCFLPYEQRKKQLAFSKLQNIAKLFNQGWKEDWKNFNQYKYYPYFQTNVACGLVGDGCGADHAYSSSCSPVVYYKDKKTSDFCGNLFIDIYSDFLNS